MSTSSLHQMLWQDVRRAVYKMERVIWIQRAGREGGRAVLGEVNMHYRTEAWLPLPLHKLIPATPHLFSKGTRGPVKIVVVVNTGFMPGKHQHFQEPGSLLYHIGRKDNWAKYFQNFFFFFYQTHLFLSKEVTHEFIIIVRLKIKLDKS